MPSSDEFVYPYGRGDTTVMTEEEVAAVCQVARQAQPARLRPRADLGVGPLLCLKYGVNIIHHATYADDETIDMLVAAKDEVFVVPAIGITHNTAYESAEFGMPPESEIALRHHHELAIVSETVKKLHARGVRVLPFGDYASPGCPTGRTRGDFEHFVNYFDFTPAEVLHAATKLGGELYAFANAQGSGIPEMGEVKEGYLADLIMIDGDPLADLTLFQDKNNILMVMKDGAYHKPAPAAPPGGRSGGVKRRSASVLDGRATGRDRGLPLLRRARAGAGPSRRQAREIAGRPAAVSDKESGRFRMKRTRSKPRRCRVARCPGGGRAARRERG